MAESKKQNARLPHHTAGFTLFEVLVTIFVFSVGLLGIASLQVLSKRANFEAVQRTTASFLANDLIERMRANPAGLASYVPASVGNSSISSEPSPNCNAAASACTVTQLAEHDLWEWEQAIDGATELIGTANTGGLVSPTGCITGPVASGEGSYTVAVAWRGQTALSDPIVNGCGRDSGRYGTDDEFRRVLAITTYISDDQ